MTHTPPETDPLEAHFRALREDVPTPDDALMARILADADAVQADRDAMTAPALPQAAKPDTLITQIIKTIGGWPGLAGLATAGIAGVWIGVSAPATLMQTSELLLLGAGDDAIVDMDPGYAFVGLEGGL